MIGAALNEPAQLGDQACQAPAFDELHGEIRDLVDRPDGMYRHDVRVPEQPGDLGFKLKPLERFRVHRGGHRQDLQGDASGDRSLPRLVNDAHTTPADLADDVKIGEDFPLGRPVPAGTGDRNVAGVDRFERGQPLQNGQELAECVGMIGMRRHEPFDVDRLASKSAP